MDLELLYSTIEQYAMQTQNVQKYTIGDPYIIFNALNMTYPVFNAALNYVTYQDHTVTVNMSFYYAVKQKNDSSNIYEGQTEGMNALFNVIRHLEDHYEMDNIYDVQMYPFSQRFADQLCGAYCTVDMIIPLEHCQNYDKEE